MKRFLLSLFCLSALVSGCTDTAPEIEKQIPEKLQTPMGLAIDEATVTSTSFVASWEALASDDVKAYVLEYKPIDGSEYTEQSAYTNNCTVTGLQHSTTYVVRLRALSAHGEQYHSDYTAELEQETLIIFVVTPPENLRIVDSKLTSSSVLVEWDAVENAIGYVVTCTAADTGAVVTERTEQTSLTVRGLEPNTQYDIKVKSCSRSGEQYDSEYSSSLVAKTKVRGGGIFTSSDLMAFVQALESEYAETGTAYGMDYVDENGVVNIKDNIDMAGIEFAPISNFSGILDGNGFTISNLKIATYGENTGLFATLTNATVRNLNLDSSCTITVTNLSGASYAGAVVGSISGDCTFENITSNVTLSGATYMGGIAGSATKANGTVLFKNCKNYGTLTYPDMTAVANISFGGICGGSEKGVTYDGCTNYGAITVNSTGGNKYNVAGGIVGIGSDQDMFGCANEGAIQMNCRGANNIYAAGMVGRAHRIHAENCTNSANISISESSDGQAVYLSGLFGTIEGTALRETKVYKCSNSGNIAVKCTNAKDVQVGGIMGWIKVSGCEISECTNSGNLSMTSAYTGSYVAGIVSIQTSTLAESEIKTISKILNCSNTGNISYTGSESNSAWNAPAGICGKCTADFLIEGCENRGNITSDNTTRSNPAGIGSEINCDVVNCTNYGTIYTTSWHQDYYSATAGIIARYQTKGKTIRGCKNYGTVAYAGKGFRKANANKGIVGQAGICALLYAGDVENCENYGTILGNTYDASHGLASYLNAKGAIVGWGGANSAVTISGCKVGGAIGECDETTEDLGASKATSITADNYTNYIYGGDAKNGVTATGCTFGQQ
ncbi:MAG: fibronectin type III domain-containing protein [Alistipes sp.]|nr:fibronectin type III domain-containing protein [Alistipes sp.]